MKRRRILLAVVAAASLLLVGCGGDSFADPSAETASGKTTTGESAAGPVPRGAARIGAPVAPSDDAEADARIGAPVPPSQLPAGLDADDRAALAAARAWIAERAEDPPRRPPSQHRTSAGAWECRTSADRCQAVAEAAEVLALRYPWEELGWEVVVDDPSPVVLGATSPRMRTITVRPPQEATAGSQSAVARWLFAHEVGHAVWFAVLPDSQREAYRVARGLPADTPVHVDPPHDFESVEEDYAEVFAWLMVGSTPRSTAAAVPPDATALAQWFPAP